MPDISRILQETSWRPARTFAEGIMKHCIACGKLLPEASLFELTSAPASAQDIPDAASVQQDKGVTLQLRQCSGCGLVQFDCDPCPITGM